MFEFDEKNFNHFDKDSGCGVKPHYDERRFDFFGDRPKRFTLTEEFEKTAHEMRETISRLMRFEEMLREKVECFIKHITTDNVEFKETFAEGYNSFISAVQREVNKFESETEAANALFKELITSNFETLADTNSQAIANEFQSICDDIATYKAQLQEVIDSHGAEVDDAVNYLKDNLSATMYEVVNTLIYDGVIDTITNEAYDSLIHDIYGSAFGKATIETIKETKLIDTFTVSTPNTVYDFKGCVINHLIIATTGATIKNAVVKSCAVNEGSRNCAIENVRFENPTQCVVFNANTWAFCFDKCSFIGTGTTVAMNAGANNTNTTLILTNCYFYKCAKLINANGGFVGTIIGGWCDEAEEIVHLTSGNCEININGFDFEAITHVFCAEGYTFTTISVGGVIGVATSIVHFTNGIVNLNYNGTINGNVKLFSDTCPSTRYCNIAKANECKYPFHGSEEAKTITFNVPPNSTVKVLDEIHVNKITCNNASAEVYTNYGKYPWGTTLNAVVPIYLRNTAETHNNITLTITTYNAI